MLVLPNLIILGFGGASLNQKILNLRRVNGGLGGVQIFPFLTKTGSLNVPTLVLLAVLNLLLGQWLTLSINPQVLGKLNWSGVYTPTRSAKRFSICLFLEQDASMINFFGNTHLLVTSKYVGLILYF